MRFAFVFSCEGNLKTGMVLAVFQNPISFTEKKRGFVSPKKTAMEGRTGTQDGRHPPLPRPTPPERPRRAFRGDSKEGAPSLAVSRGPGEIGIPRPPFSWEGRNRFFLAAQKEMVPENPPFSTAMGEKETPKTNGFGGVFMKPFYIGLNRLTSSMNRRSRSVKRYPFL